VNISILLLASAVLAVSASNQPKEVKAKAALFRQFDTILHVTPKLLEDSPKKGDSERLVVGPFRYLKSALDQENRRARLAIFADTEAIFLGAKDYRPPNGLGNVISTRCYVMVLRVGTAPQLSKLLGKGVNDTTGHTTWHWQAALGEFGENEPRASSLYAAQIGGTFILLCNDQKELGTLTELLDRPPTLPSSADSEAFSKLGGHDFWGYRRLRKLRSTQPDFIFAGTPGLGSGAEGILLFLEQGKREAVLHLLTDKDGHHYSDKLSSLMTVPPARAIGPGEWEARFPLDSTGRYSDTAFQVLWIFGLGVVV
jgi:hypothetical protein